MINHRLLCLFKGECFLGWGVPKNEISTSSICVRCQAVSIFYKSYGIKPPFSDYSSPNTYKSFIAWMEKKKLKMWEELYDYFWEIWYEGDARIPGMDLHKWIFSLTSDNEPRVMQLLSEWLALPEVKEKWGWEECEADRKNCLKNCNGSGRIKAEWAKETT